MRKSLKRIPFKGILPFWPILALCLVVEIFFYPVILKNRIPMPADITVGMYYPWLDYKFPGYDSGIPVKNPLISDIPSVIYPERLLSINEMKTGRLPLWNNLMFSGYPLAATFQSAAFNPLNLIYLATTFINGWTIQIMLQLFFASIFSYLFLHQIKVSKLASFFGSVAFTFSGFNIFFLEFNVHTLTASFIPLLLYFTTTYIDTRKKRFLIFSSFTVAFQLLSGYPQLTLYTLVMVSIWSAVRLKIWQNFRQKIPEYIWVNIFLGFGILMTMFQLLPGLELFKYSQRGSEVLQLPLRFLPLEQLTTFVTPDYFGNDATQNFWGPGNYANSIGYTGFVTLIIAFISLLKWKQNNVVKFFSLLILFCLLISVYSPISLFMTEHLLPGAKAASMTRIFTLLNFGLAVLAAIGLDVFLETKRFTKILLSLLPSFIIFGIVFISTLLLTHFFKVDKAHMMIAFRNSVVAGVFLVATTFLLIAGQKFKQFKLICSLGIVLLLCIELLRFGWKITPFSERQFLFPNTPVTNFLTSHQANDRISTGDVIPANMWMPYNLKTADGYDAVYPASQSKLISLMNSKDVNGLPMTRYGRIEKFNSALLDLTDTKYILALKHAKNYDADKNGKITNIFNLSKFKPVFDDQTVVVLQNQQSMPRAFLTTNWQVRTDVQSLPLLVNDEFVLSRELVLDQPVPGFSQSSENTSTVNNFSENANTVNMDVKTQKPGLLFLSNTWYPGWVAKVDGQITPIFKADYAFEAVAVKQGSHHVEFSYRPDSFKFGLIISVVSWLILCLYSIVTIYKKHA